MRTPRSNVIRASLVVAVILVLAAAGPARRALAASATIDIPDKYATVEAGDRLYFDLQILYPENTVRQDLRIRYVVRKGGGEDGEIVATDNVLKAIETQASFTDYITIPDDAAAGLYTVEADIDSYDGSLSEQVSGSFEVAPVENLLATYFYILLGAILGVGLVLFLEVRHLHRR